MVALFIISLYTNFNSIYITFFRNSSWSRNLLLEKMLRNCKVICFLFCDVPCAHHVAPTQRSRIRTSTPHARTSQPLEHLPYKSQNVDNCRVFHDHAETYTHKHGPGRSPLRGFQAFVASAGVSSPRRSEDRVLSNLSVTKC